MDEKMMMQHKVYVLPDEMGRIVAVNSGDFLTDPEGWVQVDEGVGDRYHHAQGNYLPKAVMTDESVYRYKLENGEILERTAEELAKDVTQATPAPSLESRVSELEEALNMILTGVVE